MNRTSHFDICWPCCPDQKNHSVKRLQHQDRVALQRDAKKRFNIPQQKTLTSTSDLDPVQEQNEVIDKRLDHYVGDIFAFINTQVGGDPEFQSSYFL